MSKKKDIIAAQGTVKAAILENDPECPNLIAASVYDTKPVHFLSMALESSEWVVKQRAVWNDEKQEKVFFEYLWLNINDNLYYP